MQDRLKIDPFAGRDVRMLVLALPSVIPDTRKRDPGFSAYAAKLRSQHELCCLFAVCSVIGFQERDFDSWTYG